MSTKLLRLIRQNLRRNLRTNLLSSVGVIAGIAAFSFFLALDGGVRRVVLGEIFPVDRMEVVPPKASLFGSGRHIDDGVIARLKSPPPEVGARPAAVFPRMKLAFPARGWGGKEVLRREKDLYFEITGFCDGVDDAIMGGEIRAPFAFEDWLAKSKPQRCAKGNVCPAGYYCAWDLYECHRAVPAVISNYLIEIYNGSLAASNPALPKIPDFLTSIFAGKSFTVELGVSYFGSRAERGGNPIQRKLQLVGVSDRAVPLGITVPLGYVKRWNARYHSPEAAKTYSSAVIVVRSKTDITPLAAYVKSIGFDLAESQGEKVGLFITLATLLFTLISVIIVGIAAINIAHTFLMVISERRREIGVLRAVGATRAHIRFMVLGEAAILGVFSGGAGLLLAWLAAWTGDWYSATRLPDFPFKPETYFHFSPGLIGASLGFAVLFCLLGAVLPAHRAASLQPAEALSMR